MKTCKCCGETKPLALEYFYKSLHTEDGYADKCRVCCVEETKASEARIAQDKRGNRVLTISKTAEERKAKAKAVYERKKAIVEALKQGHKSCSKCGETKSLFDFHVNKKNFSGYDSWCKSCKKEHRA
jgi:hypothetical protein